MSIKCVLVTGASGFIASNFMGFLSKTEKPPRIVGVGRSKDGGQICDTHYQMDLMDSSALKEVLDKEAPDLVLHAAAVTPPCDDRDLWAVNVGGTNSLLQAIGRSAASSCRIILIGSAAEYRMTESGCLAETDEVGGETSYGQSKWAQIALAKELAHMLNLQLIVARPFNLTGPGLPARWVVASLVNQFRNNEPSTIVVGNTNSERDFLDVRDCASALWAIATKGKVNESYNISTGKPTKISEVIDILHEQTQHRHKISIDKSRFRNVDLDRVYGDNHKIVNELGWKQEISLLESLTDMMAY